LAHVLAAEYSLQVAGVTVLEGAGKLVTSATSGAGTARAG
jgi:hypothetical protein